MRDLHALLPSVLELARAAGREIMAVYARDFRVDEKADSSPLTDADLRSQKLILAGLARLTPDIPIVAEEAAAVPFEERSRWPQHWLVDPLDGTREFVSRNPEFTVNIALVHDHRPVLGVVHAPMLGLLYAARRGGGARCNGEAVHVSDRPIASAICTTGFPFRAKAQRLAEYFPVCERALRDEFEDLRRAGSASVPSTINIVITWRRVARRGSSPPPPSGAWGLTATANSQSTRSSWMTSLTFPPSRTIDCATARSVGSSVTISPATRRWSASARSPRQRPTPAASSLAAMASSAAASATSQPKKRAAS